MTDPSPSVFLRLKGHFRECLVLYLVLILGVTVLFFLIFNPNNSPPETFAWLRDISPLADTLAMYGIALGLSGLCLAGIVIHLRKVFRGTEPAPPRRASSLSVPGISIPDRNEDAGADRPDRDRNA